MTYPQTELSSSHDGAFLRGSRLSHFAARLSSSEIPAIGGFLVLGATCGVMAKVADESGVSWASDLGTFPAAWVLVLALISRLSPSPGHAAARALAFFLATCLAYYGWSLFVMGFSIDRNVWLWTGLAITVVPAIGAVLHWACIRNGPLPGLILATVAAMAVADGLIWQLWWVWGGNGAPEGFPLRPFQAIFNVTVALVICGAFPRNHLTRFWAIALLVPGALVVARLVDYVMGFLLRFV